VPRNRVLLVDDEAEIRFCIRDYLESRGYEVMEAESCQQAQEAFRAAPPDAAVLDYSLPDGSALELLPRLRALHPGVALLVLTGHGSMGLAERALQQGAEQVLAKPVELSTLHTVLGRMLDNQRSLRKQAARKPEPTSS
jgi:DNA-binding NtrC family response regulator